MNEFGLTREEINLLASNKISDLIKLIEKITMAKEYTSPENIQSEILEILIDIFADIIEKNNQKLLQFMKEKNIIPH